MLLKYTFELINKIIKYLENIKLKIVQCNKYSC